MVSRFILFASCVSALLEAGRGLSKFNLEIDTDRQPVRSVQNLGTREESSSSNAPSSSSSQTAVSTGSQSVIAPSSTPSLQVPRPFDTILGDNFTQPSCPNFFNSFIVNNSTLQSCVPFSLLLQNSRSFFQASMAASTLNPILEASCNASFQTCSALMSSLANTLTSPTVCGNDLSLGNPLVIRAYYGLVSYGPMFNAACLKKDPSGHDDGGSFPYCYTSALNSSTQADSEIYFLPLGVELSAGNPPSCSTCTQQIMKFFADAASNTSSPLNKDYLGAANMVNSACGTNFVNSSPSLVKDSSGAAKGISNRERPRTTFSIFLGLTTSTILSLL